MKLFRSSANLRRTTRLVAAAFIVITLAAAAIAFVSRQSMRQGVVRTESLTGKFLPGLIQLAEAQADVARLNTLNLQFALARDDAAMQAITAAFEAQVKKINADITAFGDDTGDGAAHAAAVQAAVRAITESAGQFQTKLREGDFEQAMALLDGAVAKHQRELEQRFGELAEHYFELSQEAGGSTRDLIAEAEQASTRGALLVAGLAAVFMTIVLLGTGRLGRHLRQTSGSLAESADVVSEKASALAGTSRSLADDASHQAATVEETSASLEGIAASTRRTVSDAAESKQLAQQTTVQAEACAHSMGEMSVAMDEVKQSSDKIARIIKTIDEIAFQTNILALNAAVEAARAGDAGAGFAVVADEVRALAQRSAEAARETSVTIEDALRRTDRTVNLTREVATGLGSMVEQTRKVNTIMTGIADACAEQNTSLDQLRVAVGQINQTTQKAAATADQVAEASRSLQEQSEVLTRGVEELFSAVGAGGHHAPPPSAEPIVVEAAPSADRVEASFFGDGSDLRPVAIRGHADRAALHAPSLNGDGPKPRLSS